MNAEERQLAEMLRRVTPEPPRGVTVEDVAFRLANEAGQVRGGPRGGRARRGLGGGPGRGRGWAPVLAAASVVVVAGASAGIAQLASHHSHANSPGDGMPSSFSASASTVPSSAGPSQPGASIQPSWPPERVAGGMWGAELINRQSFTQVSLTVGAGSLYAISQGFLDRINPVTGEVMTEVAYTSPIPNLPNRPVVTGNTVWVLSSYSGTSVVLTGYHATTLAPAGTLTVPVSGLVSSEPQGVLTSGPDGNLYVAAGSAVAVVNPQTHQVTKRIATPGQVNSLAVDAGGNKLAVAIGAFRLIAYELVTDTQILSSSANFGGPGGNLIATSGGVWGTVGVGMTERVWFAPNANLSHVVMVSQGAGAGLDSVPTYSNGAVWIGGSHTLACADPVTGQVRASTVIPTDNSVVEYFGSVTADTGTGRTYALYQNQAAQQSGVATLTPPAACSG